MRDIREQTQAPLACIKHLLVPSNSSFSHLLQVPSLFLCHKLQALISLYLIICCCSDPSLAWLSFGLHSIMHLSTPLAATAVLSSQVTYIIAFPLENNITVSTTSVQKRATGTQQDPHILTIDCTNFPEVCEARCVCKALFWRPRHLVSLPECAYICSVRLTPQTGSITRIKVITKGTGGRADMDQRSGGATLTGRGGILQFPRVTQVGQPQRKQFALPRKWEDGGRLLFQWIHNITFVSYTDVAIRPCVLQHC